MHFLHRHFFGWLKFYWSLFPGFLLNLFDSGKCLVPKRRQAIMVVKFSHHWTTCDTSMQFLNHVFVLWRHRYMTVKTWGGQPLPGSVAPMPTTSYQRVNTSPYISIVILPSPSRVSGSFGEVGYGRHYFHGLQDIPCLYFYNAAATKVFHRDNRDNFTLWEWLDYEKYFF